MFFLLSADDFQRGERGGKLFDAESFERHVQYRVALNSRNLHDGARAEFRVRYLYALSERRYVFACRFRGLEFIRRAYAAVCERAAARAFASVCRGVHSAGSAVARNGLVRASDRRGIARFGGIPRSYAAVAPAVRIAAVCTSVPAAVSRTVRFSVTAVGGFQSVAIEIFRAGIFGEFHHAGEFFQKPRTRRAFALTV